jgi:branched-chain amino acid transport system permease protein
MDTFVSTVLTGLIVGSIYSLLALGLILLYKATGVVNLAHGGVMVLGAYVASELMVSSGLPAWLGFILTLIFGVFMGLLLYWVAMRRLVGESPFAIFVLTLVIAIVFDSLVGMIWKGEVKSFEILPLTAVNVFGVPVAERLLYSSGAAVLLFIILVVLFRYTRVGLAMRCVSENILVSQSLGIKVRRIFAMAWVVACVVAVVSGVLYGAAYSVNPTIGQFGLIKGLPVILLGGLESIPGAFIGGLVLGLAEISAAAYMEPAIGYECRVVVAMFLMLIVLLVRPQGLFGQRRIERI